jgi:glycogen synthase
MKILFLCNEYPPVPHGGIGTVTRTLANGLIRRGHTVIVAGLYEGCLQKMEMNKDEGIIIYKIKKEAGPFGFIRSSLLLYRWVKKIISQQAVDLLEAPDYLGLLAFWPRLRIPVVVRLHGSVTYFAYEMSDKLSKRIFLYELQTLKKATRLISVSKYAAEKTKRIFHLDRPIDIVYNPVKVLQASLYSERTQQYKVVFSGTLMEKKGVFPLIAAWPDVIQKIPKARLHLYGKDSLNALGASIQVLMENQLSIEDKKTVMFYGHTDRDVILNELKTANAAVFPSFSETFGLGPLEAMAQGCPTIYTKKSCGPEIITDGKDGLLVDPHSPQEIASAIIRILMDQQLAGRLGAEGRKTVERRFSEERIIEENEKIYCSLIPIKHD